MAGQLIWFLVLLLIDLCTRKNLSEVISNKTMSTETRIINFKPYMQDLNACVYHDIHQIMQSILQSSS
jgi:hypothetical protein